MMYHKCNSVIAVGLRSQRRMLVVLLALAAISLVAVSIKVQPAVAYNGVWCENVLLDPGQHCYSAKNQYFIGADYYPREEEGKFAETWEWIWTSNHGSKSTRCYGKGCGVNLEFSSPGTGEAEGENVSSSEWAYFQGYMNE